MGVLLGNYIKNGRRNKRLSAQKLCDIVGISRSFLVFIEKGEREPMADKLKLITDALELSYEQAIELQAQDGKQRKFISVNGGFGTGKTHLNLEALSKEMNNKHNSKSCDDIVNTSFYDSSITENSPNSYIKCKSGIEKKLKSQDSTLENNLINILNTYMKDLGWQTTITDRNMYTASDITCTQGDKTWEIEVRNFLSNEPSPEEMVIRLFGNLSLKITDYNKRYSIATNDKNLFAMLIDKTPKIFTEITSLSYILIENDGSITLKEMKSYL